MWRVEAELKQNRQEQALVQSKIEKQRNTITTDDAAKAEEMKRLKSELARLKSEQAAIMARDKKISDDLPQKERELQERKNELIRQRQLQRER